MKKKSFLLAAILILTLVFSACGASTNDAKMESVDRYYGAGMDLEMEAPAESAKPSLDGGSWTGVNSDVYNDTSNKIIRTAYMVIQTTDFDATVEGLARLTEENGGYYENAHVEGGGYYDSYARRSAYYTVRIPKENFTAFRSGAGEIGHLYSVQEGTQDVGESYYDTESRLATLTTKRDRLLALLEEAKEMEDIITLENALAEVMYEIDRHTGTLRKYDSLINYSTFTITINEVVKIVDDPGPEDSFGVKLLANLKRGGERFADNVQDFILWVANNLIGLVIFAAVVVAALILVRRKVRRVRRRRETPNEE